MANPARDIRNNAQARWPGASVLARERSSITHQHPTDPNRRMLDTSIGPLHIKNTQTEIDTAIQPSTGAWQYEMVLADYNVHMRSVFNVGNIIEYRDPVSDQWVIFDPQSINWIDENTSRQQIAIKQAITAQVDGDVLNFPNAYGTGRHFKYICRPGKFVKLITIDSLASLPTPTVQGNQIWFEAEFSLSTSSSVTIWLDGVQWAKTNGVRVKTANRIEFRDAAGVQVFWHLDYPRVMDSNNNEVFGEMEVRRQGGPSSLFITVRIPYTWIQSATFPIYIDPTIDPAVGASGDDGYWMESTSNFDNTSNGMLVGLHVNTSRKIHGFARFTGVTMSGTIDVAYLTVVAGGTSGTVTNVRTKIYADDQSSPSAITSVTDGNGRTVTTAGVDWDPSSWSGTMQSPSIVSVIQELVDSYTYSSGTLQILHKEDGSLATSTYIIDVTYDHTSLAEPILHVEYTAGGGGAAVPVFYHHLQQQGIS